MQKPYTTLHNLGRPKPPPPPPTPQFQFGTVRDDQAIPPFASALFVLGRRAVGSSAPANGL
jgi:hypothetical protein